MLHTKYQSSRPCGFRQEDFFLFIPIYAYRRMAENGFACRELKAESFKRCLHSVRWGVSL